MSIDPSEIVQAGSTVYEASPGSIPTTFIPTTSTGGWVLCFYTLCHIPMLSLWDETPSMWLWQ